ncbi:MAG: NADPH-dependent assimilatory sulfite reductase hemoprotein subunit [Planctomycetota bacterium]|nr:MAG: NADPH-dependent assimilatory sulfite reductase hemoprotein subunit [Planctomycetota bacterium]REJ94118.1 MAG: NADPH-dependent assimilatory sulfite reductase hemoprotein subunit [Planctomycetota bacterium]
MSEKQKKLSPVEKIKSESRQLRGEIAAQLADENDFFSKDSTQLLKHHGTYQQDDRDARKQLREQGGGKAYSLMVRSKIPGGKLASRQLLAELDLCDELGNGTLRITTRQALQLHGILKKSLAETMRRINEVELTTLGACGDVNRNVMCCPAPFNGDPVHQQMQDLTDRLAEHLAPQTRAYHEIWLQDPEAEEKVRVNGSPAGEDVEPIYGKVYLPRKFKIGIALPGDNCIDVYSHDVGLLAVCEDFQVVGYNVLVGGGFGVTPSAKKTFPALAKPLAYVTPEQVIDVVTAIVGVQRDFGNRGDRKVARLKYLVANWGVEAFKAKVEEYYGQSLATPLDIVVEGHDDHIGWFSQGDGRWFYGLNVENGRIKDEGDFRLKSALREICGKLAPPLRLTAHQGLLFTDLEEGAKSTIDEILRRHGVPLHDELSVVRRWSMACPAMPTCGLAVTESERALPGIMDKLERELDRLGLADEVFTTRMTGCPNGCARPYNSDIGLVGKTLGKYTILLGGRTQGDRLNTVFQDVVPAEEVVSTLVALFELFKEQRHEGEQFGDFCDRRGVAELAAEVGGPATAQ